MEQEPPPSPRTPLGRPFWLTLLAPLVIGAAILAVGHGHDLTGPIGLTIIASIACSIAAAVMLSRALVRTGAWRVALTVIGVVLLQVFYTIALVSGCGAASQWKID